MALALAFAVIGACKQSADIPAVPGVARVGTKNDIASERLAPALLRDSDEMAAYIRAFPRDQYKVYPNVLIGNFYVDDIDDFIKNKLRTGAGWEPKIYEQLQAHARPGTTAIDAGAHIGTHTVALARFVGPEGRVYAFEPQKKLYRELVENLQLQDIHNVYPLRFALGDQSAVVEMSPAAKGNEGGTGMSGGGDKVEQRTIDSFGFANVSVMKIDTEGAEGKIIAGARETIMKWKPALVVEILGGNDIEHAAPEMRAEIQRRIAMIEGFGYQVQRTGPCDYLAIPR